MEIETQGLPESSYPHKDESLLPRKGFNFAKLMKIVEKNRNNILRALVEFAMVVSVFFIAWTDYRNKSTVTLVSQCGSCQGECQSMTSLNQQGSLAQNFLNFAFVYKDNCGATETTVYSYVHFQGSWSSCQLDNPEVFTSGWFYVNKSLANIPTSLDKSGYGEQISIETNIEPSDDPTIDDEFKPNAYPPPSCFVLNCSLVAGSGYNFQLGVTTLPIFQNYSNTSTISAFLYETLLVEPPGQVTASCYSVVNGVYFPILTISNTVVPSNIYQCTSYTSPIASVGIALTYALTTASVIRSFHYFSDLMRKISL
jgi:hypothetical protein